MKCEAVYHHHRCTIHDNPRYGMKIKAITELAPGPETVEDGSSFKDSPAGVRFMIRHRNKPLVKTMSEKYKFCKTSQSDVSSSPGQSTSKDITPKPTSVSTSSNIKYTDAENIWFDTLNDDDYSISPGFTPQPFPDLY
jgi:hypothetical protein